jgi:hypothetical protein
MGATIFNYLIKLLVPLLCLPDLRFTLYPVDHRILNAYHVEKNQPDGVGVWLRLPFQFFRRQAVQRPIKCPFYIVKSILADLLLVWDGQALFGGVQ